MKIPFEPKYIDSSWNDFIFREDIIKELNKIENLIGTNYFPKEDKVLRFLAMDVTKIKCIIVGMEPYPTSYEFEGEEIPIATGRSFEVSILDGKDWNYKIKQSSLRNILKTIYYNETGSIISLDEIRKEIENGSFEILSPSDLFNDLECQGVLFLNATLTVQKEKVDTHTKYWSYFMEELIKYIEKNNKEVKWLLWGDKAKTRILPLINPSKAIISMHPRLAGFVTENPFKDVKNIKWTGYI